VTLRPFDTLEVVLTPSKGDELRVTASGVSG